MEKLLILGHRFIWSMPLIAKSFFLIVVSTASIGARADLVFGTSDLQPLTSMLERSTCVTSCETIDWRIQAIMPPPGADYLISPSDQLFYFGGKTPNQCGSRCAEAYVLRETSYFRILKSGYNISAGDPLTAFDIPPAGSRSGLPSVRRILTQLNASVVEAGVKGSCQTITPTGVEGLLVRKAGELYAQAQRARAGKRTALLQQVLTVIDTLAQAQPQSQVACQARQLGGQVGVIPVAQVRAELAGLPPANSTTAAVGRSKAEAVQLTKCQHLAKIGANEQIATECLALVWAQDLQIRKQASALFGYAIQSLNRQKSSKRAPLPFVPVMYTVFGGCPFEGCNFGVWTALETKKLFDSPGGTRIVGKLVRGERVAAIDSELRVQPTKGVVISKINHLKIGETVYLLDYQGEGLSNVWVRGQVVPDPRFGQICTPMPACETAIRFPLEKVHSEWWVKVQRRNGDVAWTRGDQTPGFTGVDALGGDPIVIPDPFDGTGVMGMEQQNAGMSEPTNGAIPAPFDIGNIVAPLKQAMILVSEGQFFDKKYNNGVAEKLWAQHLGTDFRAAADTSVFATKAGVITEVIDSADPFNAAVIAESVDGSRQVYGHIRPDTQIFKGKSIRQGELIGFVRSSNHAYGYVAHLHFGENAKGRVGTDKNPPSWGWGRAPYASTCDEAVKAGWVDVAKLYGWGNAEGGNTTDNCYRTESAPAPVGSQVVPNAAPTLRIPMKPSALGETANSAAPVIEQKTPPGTSSNEGEVATATPAALEDAMRRASALGPSVDLAKAYMWLGQFDWGLQMLSAGVVSTFPEPGAGGNQDPTGEHVDVADWLSAQQRPDLAMRVLNQAERGVGATEWWRWAAIAKGYHRAGAIPQAQAILGRWEGATAATRRMDPYHQDAQALIETYIELGRMQDVRRIAATLPMDDCGFPFYMGGYRLQAHLGQHQQALTAARRCTDPTRRLVNEAAVGQIALGLANIGEFQRAQTILQAQRVDLASLHFFKSEHFGSAYARALGNAGRREEARAMIARSSGALARAEAGCHENYGDPVLRGLVSLLEVGSGLGLPEETLRTAQVARTHISRISRSNIPNCAFDFVRFARALLGMARQEATSGRIQSGQAVVQEADGLVGIDQRMGQRVFAGTVALALAQRNPARLPARAAVADTAASGSNSTENILSAYIAQFPSGQFLAQRDPPGWFGGQCVAWAKALFGLVASRSIDSLSGNAGQLPGSLRAMGFEVSDDPAAPRIGAMVVWRDGDFGHVSVVTQVHRDPGSNQITEITVSEANWGRITEAGARRWGLSLDQAEDPRVFVTEMYGVARQRRLPVSNLNRGNYRFTAYVYP